MTVSHLRRLLAVLVAVVMVVGATTVGVGAGAAPTEMGPGEGENPTVGTAPTDVSDGPGAGALREPPSVGALDGDGDGDGENVSVANAAPRADAGPNHTATAGAQVPLDATRSSDPDGDALSYRWEQVGGPVVEPVGVQSPDMTFTPFDSYAGETITFEVTVTDPAGLNDTDRVSTRIVGENSTQSTVDRVGFDYGDRGDNVNLWVNGVRRNVANLSAPAPTGVDGGTVGGVAVNVSVDARTAAGARGHVELVGNVSSFAVGGQNLSVDNVEIGSDPRENVTFDTVSPKRATHGIAQGFRSEGVAVAVERFYLANGTETTDGAVRTDNATPSPSGGSPPDVAVENLTLRFDVASATGDGTGGNAAPLADAGPNRTIQAGDTITLDGTNSSDPDGDPLAYYWNSTAPQGTLANRTTATPTFTAPTVSSTTTYRVILGVTDPSGERTMDETVVTVEPAQASPADGVSRVGFDYGDYGGNVNIAVNGDFYNLDRLSNLPGTVGGVAVQVTTANVSGGVQGHVELSGDVQSLAVGGQELFLDNVEFGPASGPHANVTFRNVTPVQQNYTVAETFTADGVPVTVENFTFADGTVYAGGQAEVQSRAVPNAGGTSPEVYPGNVNLRFDVAAVAATAPQTPTADAGRDRATTPDGRVTLDGTGSSDPNRDPLNYTWRQVAGPNATLVDGNYPTPYVVAPSVSSVRTLTFELTVADPGGNVDTDRVNVTVGPTGVAGTSVARVGFDYGEYGGNLNLEINGDFRNFDRYNRPPPVGVDGAMVGGVQVQVTNRSVAGGQQGHVELIGNVSSLALGGQELYVDNVEFGAGTTPRANVTFDNLTPAQAGYPVGATVTADGVPVTVESFTYAGGGVTNGSQAVRRNATPTRAGGVAPEIYPDNVNLRFDVAAAAAAGTEPLDVGIEIQQEATVQQGRSATVTSFLNNRANASVTNATLQLRVDANADGRFDAGEVVATRPVSLPGGAIEEVDSVYRNVSLAPGDYAYQSRLVADGASVRSFTNGTLTVTANETAGAGTVSRVGFDYGEYGGNLNLEVNGDFRNFDRFSDAPPNGVNDTIVGGANVTVRVRNVTGGGAIGHVEIAGNVSSLAVGGQELWLDNVEFGPRASPAANASFSTLSPLRSDYRVNDTFTADGVPVTVESFTYADGGTTAGGFGQPDNATPPMSGGYGTDFNTNNVNLRFDVAAAAGADTRPLDVGIELQQEATTRRGGTATVTSFLNNRANASVTNATLQLRVDANVDGRFDAGEVVATRSVSLPGGATEEVDSVYRNVSLAPGDYAYQSRLVADGASVRSFTNGTLTVTANRTAGAGAVSRVGFDYGEYGGNLNLEVNGDFRNFDRFSDAPPSGVNDTTIGGANVTVQVRNVTGGGAIGHVEIAGNVSSLAVGGQELWLDNVEFGPRARPAANVTFDNQTPARTRYRVNDTFTADGVPVVVENFTDATGNATATGFGQPDNATPPMSGGYGTDFNTNNVNLRFDVGAVANATTRNRAPIADAGADRTVTSGTSVTLDATGSSDPDGDPIQYDWLQVDGPAVSLAGGDTATPSFTAPVVTSTTTLTFEVLVRDGAGNSDTDTVTVTVDPPAGADTTTTATVVLREAPDGLYSYTVNLSTDNETLLDLEPRLTPALQETGGGLGESAVTVRSVDPSNRTYDEPVALLTATFTGNLSADDIDLTVTNLTDDDRRDMNRSLVSVRVDGPNPFPDGIPGATGDAPPGNVDDDPAYEDITGDGQFTFVDVIEFVFALDAIQSADLDAQATARLDHSGDGKVNFVDVVDLVFQL